MPGFEFAKMLEEHVRAQEGIEIVVPDKVIKVDKSGDNFKAYTEKGKVYETKTVFVGSGARRRKLGVPGEKEFDGKGVAYCSTCDAPVFAGKDVAVIGGGNAGLEAVLDLGPYAKNIWLLEYGDKLKGDPVTQEKVKALANLKEIIYNAQTLEILGDKFVTGLKYRIRKSFDQAKLGQSPAELGEEKNLDLQGVFVEIGSIPNSDMVKDLVETNKYGEIIIDSKTGRTSQKGIWAAGDVTDDPFKQNNISAGDAMKASLDAYSYLTIGEK